MPPIRPIGHIACGLNMLAINIGYRMRMSRAGCAYACWVDDDGCVYAVADADARDVLAPLLRAMLPTR